MSNTIIIKKQSELDALPDSFDVFTTIEIRSDKLITVERTWDNSRVDARGNSHVDARGNSHVYARDNSRVYARDNSRVYAWDNSHVDARDNSRVYARDNSRVYASLSAAVDCYSIHSTISAHDNSSLYLHESANYTAEETVNIVSDFIDPTFEQWLGRGYVVADGIHLRLVSSKSVGDAIVYRCKDVFDDESFVARREGIFSHGKTLKEAVEDLQYKISDRDTSEFNDWTLETVAPKAKMIEAYRKITGACAFGVKVFVEGRKIKDELAVGDVVEITKNNYGHDQFREFFS